VQLTVRERERQFIIKLHDVIFTKHRLVYSTMRWRIVFIIIRLITSVHVC
jgi:hypothetical protein